MNKPKKIKKIKKIKNKLQGVECPEKRVDCKGCKSFSTVKDRADFCDSLKWTDKPKYKKRGKW